jgi:hypothetical protein
MKSLTLDKPKPGPKGPRVQAEADVKMRASATPRKYLPVEPPAMPVHRANILKAEGIGRRPEPEYISFEDVCVRWRVDRTSVKYYIRKKILTPYHISARKVRFKLSEIKKIEADAGVAS